MRRNAILSTNTIHRRLFESNFVNPLVCNYYNWRICPFLFSNSLFQKPYTPRRHYLSINKLLIYFWPLLLALTWDWFIHSSILSLLIAKPLNFSEASEETSNAPTDTTSLLFRAAAPEIQICCHPQSRFEFYPISSSWSSQLFWNRIPAVSDFTGNPSIRRQSTKPPLQ